MAIKVCDAIMGSGKSSAAINYMNDHPDRRYIYITPYLDEAKRIIDSCPDLHFIAPRKDVPKTKFTKNSHTAKLLEEGHNIASTHQAFKYYTPEMIENIKKFDYMLFIDEGLEVVSKFDGSVGDLDLLVKAGYLETDGENYWVIDNSYDGLLHRGTFRLIQSQNLIRYKNADGSLRDEYVSWSIPPELILSFKDVVIMTYLFEGQGLYNMLLMHHIPFEHIGISRTDGIFRFSEKTAYVPEFAGHLADLIHICEHEKLNSIGDKKGALSMNWYAKKSDEVEKLKKHVANYFINIMKDHDASSRMWGTYGKQNSKLAGKGYKTRHVVFNERATNKYRDRTVLAYLVNPYMNVGLRNLYAEHGIDASDNAYALAIMVQWIWRSAIRDGKEIYLYLPSKRMRTLLIDWMDAVRCQYVEFKAAQVNEEVRQIA